jgi:pilus biogenesis lipoprotein CpaD
MSGDRPMTPTHLGINGRLAKARFSAIGIAALTLVLAGCSTTVPPGQPVAFNDFEAPPRDLIQVESSSYSYSVRLGGAAGTVSKAERDRLAAFVADVAGNRPESLRVALRGAATPAELKSVADLLIARGVDPRHIVRADLRSGPPAPTGTIVVAVERAIAVLPDCPGWVDHVSAPADNLPNPNLGCSDVNNLAQMVGDPHHLRHGASSIYTDAEAAAIGVASYRADKVKELPQTNEQFNITPRAQ